MKGIRWLLVFVLRQFLPSFCTEALYLFLSTSAWP